jgi:hypothetical protein
MLTIESEMLDSEESFMVIDYKYLNPQMGDVRHKFIEFISKFIKLGTHTHKHTENHKLWCHPYLD